MAIIGLLMGLEVKDDETFENISADGDPNGKVDDGIMMATIIFFILILFTSIFGCCTGYWRHIYCVVSFGLVATCVMFFTFAVGIGFFAFKVAGDEICDVVNDPDADIPEMQMHLYDGLDVTMRTVD